MRSLRSVFRLTREAVALATQPFAKRMRALAMSISSENTGVPTASMAAIGAPTMVCTMSMSWIMRSSTTFTSVPRSRYGASRWHSMKRGDFRYGSAARIAALKRSRCPTCRMRRGARGERDQLARLGGRLGDRLLDQHVRPGLEEIARDGEVRRRRRRDADRIDGAQQRAVIVERHAPAIRRPPARAPRHAYPPPPPARTRAPARISAHESVRDTRRR